MSGYVNRCFNIGSWGILLRARDPWKRYATIQIKAFGFLWIFSVQKIWKDEPTGLEIYNLPNKTERDRTLDERIPPRNATR